jgi:MscS family membrane protein
LLAATWLLTVLLVGRLHALARRYGVDYDSMILGSKWLIATLIFSIGMRLFAVLSATMIGRIFFEYVGRVLMVVAVSWLLVRITRFLALIKTRRLRADNLPGKIAAVELFGWLIASMWAIIGLFLILSSLGVELTAAIAGLGVGSIAIAFAAQKTLENLFGTVMIVGDDVVKVGDYCQAGAIEGRIESIGLRSTRIRTLDRALVSVPNGQLAAMSVGSLAQRDKFLFRHLIRLRYDTTGEQLREVIARIEKMLTEQADLEAASARARLVRFADTSIEIEAFAYVLTADGDVFVRRQHDLLLQIIDIVEATGTALSPPAAGVPAAATFSLNAQASEKPRAAR